MNNFQHASKSDVLTEDLTEASKVEESLEPSQPLDPPAVVLNFQGDAVVDGIHGGVKVDMPEETTSLSSKNLHEADVFEKALPAVQSEDLQGLDETIDSDMSAVSGTASEPVDESIDKSTEVGVTGVGATEAGVFDISLFDAVIDGEEAQQKFVERTFASEGVEASELDQASAPMNQSTDAAALVTDAGSRDDAEMSVTEVSTSDATDQGHEYGEDVAEEGEYAVEEYEYAEYEYEEVEAEDPSSTVETTGEVMEVEVIDSEEHDRSYEVYQQGSLTYFRYYLDDEENGGAYDHEVPISPKPFLSAGAMGVGVLAATFGVGLLVAETTNRRANVAAEGGPESEQRQIDGKTEVSSAIKTDKVKPETGTPDWSAADKAFGKSVTAKSGKDNLLGAEPTETLASAAAERISGEATSVDADVQVAQADVSASSGSPTWRTSITVPPYVPPIASSSAANYQVVPMTPLPPVSIASVSSASEAVKPSLSTASEEDRRLAARIEALRQAAADSPAPLPTPAAVSSAQSSTVATAPSGTGSTYVTDPIQAMQPIPEANYQPAPSQPAALSAPGGPKIETLPLNEPQGAARGDEISATAPSLLAAAPEDPVPYELKERFEEQKRLMNQAIAQPVAGLLVVPVAANNIDEQQSSVPLNVIPQPTDSTGLMEESPTVIPSDAPRVTSPEIESPANSAAIAAPELMAQEVSLLETTPLETDVPLDSIPLLESDFSSNNPLPEAPVTADTVNLVASLGELLTLAQQPKAIMLQPIASEFAQEIRETEQLEQFRILALNDSDYEQLWRMRASQPSTSLMAPAYGFVDYQRNEIALIDSASSGLARMRPEVQREGMKQIAQALTPVTGELK